MKREEAEELVVQSSNSMATLTATANFSISEEELGDATNSTANTEIPALLPLGTSCQDISIT
jgi:hypothetical protein